MIWTVVADFQVPDPARIFTSTSGDRMQNFSNSGRKHHRETRHVRMLAAELRMAKKDAITGEISRLTGSSSPLPACMWTPLP